MDEIVIEGHYLESVEGLFFAVKGHLHPPQRTIAYLRYLPDKAGDRARGRVRYRRVYRFAEQEEILRHYPHYHFYDPVYGRELQGVPLSHRKRVYSPRQGLADLRRRGGGGPAGQDTLLLASLLHERAGVDWSCLGVSGSLLIGLSTPDSDIDLMVYGAENGRAVRRALRELFAAEHGEVRPLVGEGLRRLYRSRFPDTHMSWEDFSRHERRKVNQGTCRGREYFVRFVKEATEIGERYGERRYQKLGRTRIRAQVTDDADALFTPCLYRVDRVTAEGDPLPGELREVTSFRGRFSEQARTGEWIVAQGTLERVTCEREEYLRLVLGEHPEDYLIATFANRSDEL